MSFAAQKPTQALVDLVGTLGGRWSNYTAMCRCPTHADGSPSLSLRQGDTGVLVHCFAGCAAEDILRELARIRPDKGYTAPDRSSAGRGGNVQRLWDDAEPVERSLAARYLDQRGLVAPYVDLRFHSRCPKGAKPHTKFLPALMVAIKEDCELRAIQRIFLDPNTAHYTEKLTIGSPGAGSWQGSRARDELALAEGFETAAAFHQLTGIPCWSTLGGERLDRVAIPDQVKRLVIAEDNDPEGRRLARKAMIAHAARGLAVRRMPPPAVYADWADALTGRKRGGGSKE